LFSSLVSIIGVKNNLLLFFRNLGEITPSSCHTILVRVSFILILLLGFFGKPPEEGWLETIKAFY